MVRIELAPEILDDFDRILDHLERHGSADGQARIAEIVEAIQLLGRSPLIGRPNRSGNRELVIGRGSRGYVVLYRFVPNLDAVFVLALRSQRQLGYKREK